MCVCKFMCERVSESDSDEIVPDEGGNLKLMKSENDTSVIITNTCTLNIEVTSNFNTNSYKPHQHHCWTFCCDS